MEHIYFFYFLITLLIGLMSLGTAAAETLFISVSTVKFHLSNIYAKFGVKSRYEVLTFFRNAEKDRSMS